MYLNNSALLPPQRHLSSPRLSPKILLSTLLRLTAEFSYLRRRLKAAARSLEVPRVEKQNDRIVLCLRSVDRALHPFNSSGGSVFWWRGGVCVCVRRVRSGVIHGSPGGLAPGRAVRCPERALLLRL